MKNLRSMRWIVLILGLALVAAACGGGGGGGGSGKPATKQGGTLNYGADQEPTGFNNNTSKDNGTSVANVMINVLPQAFHLTPDFKVAMNTDLLDSAEQTSSQPQTIVYKIKQNAVWSDERLEVAVLQRELHPAGALRQQAAWRLEHRSGQEPAEHPLGRPLQGAELHPRPEPDAGPQRPVLRQEGEPGLDRLPVPAGIDHPAGGAAEQRSRHDLPAAPARHGPAGQGPAGRVEPDQPGADVRAP